MTRNNTLKLFAVGIVIVWCALFLRAENTEKSIVRALFLEQTNTGWSAGLLYQFPEASADASETDAQIRFALASGQTPQAALTQAEEKLPRKASYRLCDYLVLGPESDFKTLQTCEALFLEHPYGRLASHVFCADFSGAALETQTEEDEYLPESLLDLLKSDKTAPRLYENRNGVLLPVFALSDGELSSREEHLLLTETNQTPLTADQTEAALFLSGAKRTCQFQTETNPIELTNLAQSVEPEGEGFHLVLTCRVPPNGRTPTDEELAQWEALCTETVRLCWKNGFDLLRLSSVQALRDGTNTLTTKNACPNLRTDVVIF